MSTVKCLCFCLDPGQASGPDAYPAEWEQNPFCPVHPDEPQQAFIKAHHDDDFIKAMKRGEMP